VADDFMAMYKDDILMTTVRVAWNSELRDAKWIW
jgi:hypothetical protein